MNLKKIVSGLTSLALSVTAFGGIGFSGALKNSGAEAASANWKFDFGGKGAASGYTGVSASEGYNSGKGYGFAQTGSVKDVDAAGSGALSDAVQFVSTDIDNTFNVDLPNGLYQITVTTGNTSRTSIKAEGMLQLMNLTGNNAVETFQIPVTDGQLNIQATEGRANTPFTLSTLEITQLNTTGTTNPTVWLCGDSTVANYYNTADTSQHGWGQYFGSYISESGYQVRNMAASGQYAKGFVDAGQFTPIEAYGKAGDYYIISIGINDTNYSNATEYYETVTDMVKKTKAKGMEVILVKQQGRRSDLNRNPKLGGRWFGGQLDTIGQEQGVQVVDLFTPWQDFGISVGFDAMEAYYAADDDLHQSKLGSQKLAELMAGLVTIGKEPAVMDTSKTYMFRNVNSGLYMEVANASAQTGANVQQWGASEPSAHNTWRLKHKGYNYYEIYTYLDGGSSYLLNVDSGSAENGANIALNTNTNNGEQWFRFFENSDGSYTMVSRCSKDKGAVEIVNAMTTSGANVQQWELNGHSCQNWILEVVDYPPVTTTTTPTTTTTTTTTTTSSATTSTSLVIKKHPGDVNVDGKVDMSDAVFIMQSLSNPGVYGLGEPKGLTVQGAVNADIVNNDGITNEDALFIQRCMLELDTLPEIEYYPPEEPIATTTADIYAGYYFALDQTWEMGVEESSNAGFMKDGYVNLDNVVDSNITWTVDAESDGNYLVTFRVANGTDADRQMKIFVNGNTQEYWMQPFTGTGSWTTWGERGIVLPLKAGKNTIKLVSETAGGGPNFDYLTLMKTDEPIAEIYDPNKDEPVIETDKPVIYIAGDSTVQSYRASYAPQQGWGYYLQNYFADNVTVSNHAIAGRSSKSFYDQGRFQTIADSLKEGDYVMIQFAINDSAASNAERYAPVCGNADNPSEGSYEWYLTQFIKSTMEKGATPILVTTVIGMKAYSDGKFVGSYTNYCDACKKLAAKYNVPCIDLNSLMVVHYNSIGYNAALKYHLMGVVEGSTDGTHFCEEGANNVAALVAKDVKEQKIDGLDKYVK